MSRTSLEAWLGKRIVGGLSGLGSPGLSSVVRRVQAWGSLHVTVASSACVPLIPLRVAEENQAVVLVSVQGFCLFCFAASCGLRDLTSQTRDRTWALGNESVES